MPPGGQKLILIPFVWLLGPGPGEGQRPEIRIRIPALIERAVDLSVSPIGTNPGQVERRIFLARLGPVVMCLHTELALMGEPDKDRKS